MQSKGILTPTGKKVPVVRTQWMGGEMFGSVECVWEISRLVASSPSSLTSETPDRCNEGYKHCKRTDLWENRKQPRISNRQGTQDGLYMRRLVKEGRRHSTGPASPPGLCHRKGSGPCQP